MSPGVYFLTISLPLLTAIIVFAMKYASAFAAARAQQAETQAVKMVAGKSAEHQAQTAASLKAIESELLQLSRSVLAVETMLKDVE